MSDFVALRVIVQPNESNRAALNRTLNEGQIPFPLVLPTPRPYPFRFETPNEIPDKNCLVALGGYVVKYEAA